MAISAPVSLVSGSDPTNQSTPYSFSMTPTNGRLVRINVLTEKSAATAALPTLSGGGLTYTLIADVLLNSDDYRLSAFWTVRPSGSGAITVSIDIGGVAHIGCGWSVYEYDGADTTSPIVGTPVTAFNNTLVTSISAAMATFVSTSVGECIVGLGSARTMTPRASWTQIHSVGLAAPDGQLFSSYRLADVGADDVSATFSSSARPGLLGIEIAEAGGAAAALDGAAALTLDATAALTTAIALDGVAALVVVVAGDLSGGAAALDGTAALVLTATAELTAGSTALDGTAALAVATSATLTTAIAMTGTAALVLSVEGALFELVLSPLRLPASFTAAALTAEYGAPSLRAAFAAAPLTADLMAGNTG